MRTALLALLLPLAGCASTSLIDAANPADLARIQAREHGRTADITLTSGDLYRGTLVYLRPDSTAWVEAASVLTVPTADVSRLVVDTRQRALTRGMLVGAGVLYGLCFAADADGFGIVLGFACAPFGTVPGLLGGAATARRTTYVFADPPLAPGARLVPAPDAPEAGDGE